MTDLSTKVVAITGAARGIGLATAMAFADAGAFVALGDLDFDVAARAAAKLGTKAIGLRLDVTDPASFEAFLAAAEDTFGPLDVLVNNAGIMPTGLFADEAAGMTDRIIDINLRGVIIGARLAVTRFVPRATGHLINIASLAGISGFPGLATYCATKHCIVNWPRTGSVSRRYCPGWCAPSCPRARTRPGGPNRCPPWILNTWPGRSWLLWAGIGRS